MHMFYYGMNGILHSIANFPSYIPTKYYKNRSTPDLVIVKTKRVNFFETQCNSARYLTSTIIANSVHIPLVLQVQWLRCHQVVVVEYLVQSW